MIQRGNARRLIQLPARFLVTGRSGMGKTTEVINMLAHDFAPYVERLICICPTYYTQKKFRALDRFILRPSDVVTKPTKKTFNTILDHLIHTNEQLEKNGKKPPHTWIFIDDLSGTEFIQDRRFGAFSNLAIQTPHLGKLSVIAIVQQASTVSPSFRDNAEVVMSFPSQREEELNWLCKEFKNPSMARGDMRAIVNNAWRGGRSDDSEWGKHFLIIHAPQRGAVRYYADWNRELMIDEEMRFTKKRKLSHEERAIRKKRRIEHSNKRPHEGQESVLNHKKQRIN